MLEGHEPSRLRYLADKDKQVVQQYMSEKTYTGSSEGLAKGSSSESGSGGAVVAGVVGVAAVGGLATVAYLAIAKKGCFAAKAVTGGPANPAQATGV
jgi:hypothetical protein